MTEAGAGAPAAGESLAGEAAAGAPSPGEAAALPRDPGEAASGEPLSGETVVVLADDLIWATRLVGQLRTLGAAPVRCGTLAALEAELAAGTARRAVVDLTARAYDGVAATARASAAGLRVLCVGQHDDRALRAAARAAGAERVFAYRKLFEDGHAALAAWLGVPAPAPGSRAVPASAGDREEPSA